MRPRILVTRKLSEQSLAPLLENYDVDVWHSESEVMPRQELLQRSRGVAGILCLLTEQIDAELLDAAGDQLKVVSTMSVGFDHIDTELLEQRGIKFFNTPGVLDDSVADLTIALMLAAARRLPEAANAAKNGEWGTWSPYWLTGQDLSNSTVGIIGLGGVGTKVAKRLTGFGCRLIYTSRNRKPEIEQELGLEYYSQDELLTQSDFVSIHTALVDETAGMCDTQLFDKMKPSAVFVNAGRGGLVNQDCLYEALSQGKIYAAGLDVTEPEPLPTDHPLFQLSNCVILPHIGSASIKTRDAMANLAVANLLDALSSTS